MARRAKRKADRPTMPERQSKPGHVWAKGILAHHFWGTYQASMALMFDDINAARDAQAVLGEPWKVSEKNPGVLNCFVNSEQLDGVKLALGLFGAEVDKIDSVRFSVDYGEWFSVLIPVIPSEQVELPL